MRKSEISKDKEFNKLTKINNIINVASAQYVRCTILQCIPK